LSSSIVFTLKEPGIPEPPTFAAVVGLPHSLFSNFHFLNSSPAHRRQKRNLITRGNPRIPRRKLLVPRNHHRIPKSNQLWIPLRIPLKHLRQCRPLGHFPGFFGQPGQFPQPPKEQHLHPQSRHNRLHPKIVSCPLPPRHCTIQSSCLNLECGGSATAFTAELQPPKISMNHLTKPSHSVPIRRGWAKNLNLHNSSQVMSELCKQNPDLFPFQITNRASPFSNFCAIINPPKRTP